MRCLVFGAIGAFALVSRAHSVVLLNEFMAVNTSTTQTAEGRFADWIELYNKSVVAADIGGYYITDETSVPMKWRFPSPTVLPAGGRLFLWADDTTAPVPGPPYVPPYHVSFQIAGTEGERLTLFAADGATTIDTIEFGPQARDVSYGRALDGHWAWGPFRNATPNRPNTGYEFPPASAAGILFLNEWLYRNADGIRDASGRREDWVEIFNAGDIPIDLGDYYITDDLSRPNKWAIRYGNVAGPHGFVILWADDDEETEGPNHLSFNLRGEGEPLGLYEKDGFTPIDTITTTVITPQYQDVSQGRSRDGGPQFWFFSHPTPRETNYVPSADVRRWETYR